MKVCAHINYGPYANGHKRFDSISSALAYFREEVVGNPYLTTEYDDAYEISNYGIIDLYPQCDSCQDSMCFHDYPMARYGIGRRGGLRKAHI